MSSFIVKTRRGEPARHTQAKFITTIFIEGLRPPGAAFTFFPSHLAIIETRARSYCTSITYTLRNPAKMSPLPFFIRSI